MEHDMFIDQSIYGCNMSCFYVQVAGMVAGSQRLVPEMQSAPDLKTDGVQAFQKSISAYKKAGFPSQVNVQCFQKVIYI
jgi:hypothetical protein